MAVRTEHNIWYIPVDHKPSHGYQPNNIRIPSDFFLHFPGKIYAHHMKFDNQVLELADIKLPTGNLWCTMMMSVYINENHDIGHELDDVLQHYLGVSKKKKESKAMKDFGWVYTPPEYMAQYAETDAVHLLDLADELESASLPQWLAMWENYDRRFMLLLSKMEVHGIPIDRDLCEKIQQSSTQRLDEIRRELGFDPSKPSQMHPRLFSEPPVGLGLTPASYTSKTGKPQVNLKWLASQGHPVTALIHEYSKTMKQLSSYYSPYLERTTRDYPRLHPNFKQHGAETGRLSCENPNLQQIPRQEYKDAYVKKLFLPEEGKQLWEIDYRTIEYRMQAVYAQSPKLLELFQNEGDFHQMVADDVSAQVGFPVSRHQAKTINYLMSFGGGVGVLAEELGIPTRQAKKIHQGYKDANPEIFAKADEATEYAEQHGEVEMWFGRTRHFQWRSEARQAFNSCIQGGSFEIVKRSMIALDEAGFNISNQVHDSVWVNVDKEADVIEAEHIMSDWTTDFFGLTFSTDRKRLN